MAADRYPDLARTIRDMRGQIAELQRAKPSATNAAGFLNPVICQALASTTSPPSVTSSPLLLTQEVPMSNVTLDTAEVFDAGSGQMVFPRAGVYAATVRSRSRRTRRGTVG